MTTETNLEQNKTQKTIVGKVVGDKMNKTIIVQIEYKVKHPLYGKYTRRFSKMYAHDEENQCRVGDLVRIKQCRPLSKSKRWAMVEILKKQEEQ